MTSLSRIAKLEGKFTHITKKRGEIVWRDITEDGRLLDKDGYAMTDIELRQVEKENAELLASGYAIWYEVNPSGPKP